MKKLMTTVLGFFLVLNFCTAQEMELASSDDPEQWKVPEEEAQKMIGYYKSCTKFCRTSKVKKDAKREAAIREKIPNIKSITWVNARYRRADAERYSSKTKKSVDDPSNQVGGYSTMLMKVTTTENAVLYFDAAQICPPPANCDETDIIQD